jgi:hypothetical protein
MTSSWEGDLYRVLQPNNDIPIEDMAGDCRGRRDGIDRHPIALATHVPGQEQRNADEELADAQRHGGMRERGISNLLPQKGETFFLTPPFPLAARYFLCDLRVGLHVQYYDRIEKRGDLICLGAKPLDPEHSACHKNNFRPAVETLHLLKSLTLVAAQS